MADIRERGQIPSLTHISVFIRKQVKADFDPDFGDLETDHKVETRSATPWERERRKGVNATQNLSSQGKTSVSCYMCKEKHRLSDCPTFADSTIAQRMQFVRDNKLCHACLVKGHVTQECRSQRKCTKGGCAKTHHYLLHVDSPSVSSITPTSALDSDGILPVVRVRFRAANGRTREGNVLVDSGAATTIIRREFAKSLGLQGKQEPLGLSVAGGETVDQMDSRRVRFRVAPCSGGEEYEVEAHEIDKTVASVPPLDREWLASFPHLDGIQFSHKAGPVDLVLGVQYSHLHTEEEVRQGINFEPLGKRTRLGWMVSGTGRSQPSRISVNFVQKTDLSRFYDLEALGVCAPDCTCPVLPISREDMKAMKLMESSLQKNGDRYVIGLPWKKNPADLPDNYKLAEKRLQSLEHSLSRKPNHGETYKKAMEEYLDNGWAVPLTQEELNDKTSPKYYLPHHAVYRPDKPSTPLRVVFDPACTYSGVSLNSFLHKGPCLIGDLLGVLLRFREETVAFVGDISKMFLQICIPEQDSQVHRFLWRDMDASKQPSVYRLTRVTFGDKPSPDMASFVLLKIAEQYKDTAPYAAEILQDGRYMDDLISSCSSQELASKQMGEVDVVLATGSFKVKNWFISTPVKHATSLDSSTRGAPPGETVCLYGEESVKTLGVCWDPTTDTIGFKVKTDERLFTKRSVLSRMSMIYDPLGLASAVTIRGRIAMQHVWRLEDVKWDDPLQPEVAQHWRDLFADLKNLEDVQFPRCVKPHGPAWDSELHVFADASISAYGAVAYMLWHTPSGATVRLLTAKARVAPLRQTTIPRLELMAALIASRLAKSVVTELREKPTVYLWTDSSIVLHWLLSASIAMKPFVGVRVAEIQSTCDPTKWNFVPSELNPADDLSRGLTVHQLSGRWMHGPPFLRMPKQDWPVQTAVQVQEKDPELRSPKPLYASAKTVPPIDCGRYSSWQKLVRVTAWVKRAVHNMRNRDDSRRTTDTLSPDELEAAEKYWVSIAQKSLGDWNDYASLTPFLVKDIVRVGGRLRRSTLDYDQVHPVLLPASHTVSKLIMRDIHEKLGHPGSERTLCHSRRQFWITKGRNLAKQMVRSCVVCRKLRRPAHTTLMADLPADRLKMFAPPFTTTGVDLFGPFLLKYGRNKTIKAWGAIFTCATVRAVHVEIVENLSTPAFLQALR